MSMYLYSGGPSVELLLVVSLFLSIKIEEV
jgi:hypothetical protein